MNSTTITTQTTTSSLTIIQNLITQYTFTVIFIIGNFSNLANILVFLQKPLRLNAYSWYFEFVSLGHLIFLYFGCLTRIITTWSGYDLTRTSIIYCRIRIYFLTISLLMARYFLCFISIARCLLILRNLRQGHRRQVIATTQTNINRLSINAVHQFHRKDIQFIQVCIYILCNAFYGYNATYTFITQSTIKTAEQVAFNSFLSTIGLNIRYLYMAITFFLYTLVSSTFRKECFLAIKRIVHYRFH
ncbi:unnamed protein product [Adineta steineri]|uniref:Vomeronasal type-1 receptor n=1 Tax=Adineta steineri TaxID=433720 RepID=A0A813RHG4_9BILA|nr:unnamed protein product [Adineta steineri]CAF4010503.1 unnamed protein product [Adineta steineri]